MKETANKRVFEFLYRNVSDLSWDTIVFNKKLQQYYLSIQECVGFLNTDKPNKYIEEKSVYLKKNLEFFGWKKVRKHEEDDKLFNNPKYKELMENLQKIVNEEQKREIDNMFETLTKLHKQLRCVYNQMNILERELDRE